MLPASSTRVLLLRLKTFPFAARAPSQEVSGAEWSPQRHTLDRRRADWASLDCQSAAPICSVLLKRKGTSAGRIVCNNEGWNLNFAGYLLSNKNVPKAQWISGVPDRHFFRVGLCNTHLPCKLFVPPYKLSLSSKHHRSWKGVWLELLHQHFCCFPSSRWEEW